MSTLKEKAEQILQEKEEKIIAENIKKDIQIFDVTGNLEEGIDTSDANATENDLVEGTSAYVNGVKIEGTLIDAREQSSVTDIDGEISYFSGDDNTTILCYETSDDTPDIVIGNSNQIYGNLDNAQFTENIGLTADKIKKDETILGVEGTFEGTDTSDATATASDIVENTSAYVDGVKLDVRLSQDKVFVITGKVTHYKNRDELKAEIESLGGKVASSITSKTNYLINNDIASTSAKNKAAKANNIPIITEEEYISMKS